MTWFAKPEVVSAVNCARRGWINVDMDTIACEACGARLFFSTPASWAQQQVEKAALVFSLKLDNGHKLLCPWVDNACDETVAHFPPTPSPVLVDSFRERCSALLQLSALPQISSSAINYVRTPLLEKFLGQSSIQECGNGSEKNRESEQFGNEHEKDSAKLYYQAQKLLSLYGWEPRPLPYLVDCQDGSNQSLTNSSHTVADRRNNSSIILHSANTDGSMGTGEDSDDSSGEQNDPSSVVLDCSLCGATVGLWSFSTIPRPAEFFRLIGYTEVSGENGSGARDSGNENNLGRREGVIDVPSHVATTSKGGFSNLNLTIAGGPPPTKQNFRATISLPVIGQNLRSRISHDSDFEDHAHDNREDVLSNSFQEGRDYNGNATAGQIVPNLSKKRKICGHGTFCHARVADSGADNLAESTQNVLQASIQNDKPLTNAEVDVMNNLVAKDPSSSQVNNSLIATTDADSNCGNDSLLMVASGNSCLQQNFDRDVVCFNEPSSLGHKESLEVVSYISGRDLIQPLLDKGMEFDPIRQHRHFCPWIASMGNGEPGSQQTLSALFHQKESEHSLKKSPLSTSIIKVDDPIGSVRKLFESPSTKRMKRTRQSSQSTEN
ncbi:C3HC zinc finger-like protein [Quillaja saponaria]|nr:C3HC zinc finger-like protein [Quillaja saponaria]